MGFGAGCQNVLLGHVNYFELKTIMAQQTEEGLFTSPLTAWTNLDRGPVQGRELLPEINFYTRKTYLYGMAPVVFHILLFPSSGEFSSSPLKSQTPNPFLLSSDWHINLNCLTVWSSHIFGIPIPTKSIFFLLLISLQFSSVWSLSRVQLFAIPKSVWCQFNYEASPRT